MAAETLKNLKQMCKYDKSRPDRSHLAIEFVTVIDINRYLTDPGFCHQVMDANFGTSATDRCEDVYDLTLADGHNKMKVLLSSYLNHFVQQAKLLVGSILEINRSVVVYDEANLKDDGVLVLLDINITGFSFENVQEYKNLPWYPEHCILQTENRPLTSGRAYYLNLWTSADVVLPHPTPTERESLDNDQLGDVFTIREMVQRKLMSETKPAVLVRVLRKSRLLHYGKPDKTDKWPFQHQLLVADSSGMCTVVLWNRLAIQFLNQIEEGTVLFLRKFTVRKSFVLNSAWHFDDSRLKMFDIDINLNPHHPESEVRIIKLTSVPRHTCLPDITYSFTARTLLGSLPDGFICDVAGLVTYVGSVRREMMKCKFSDSGGFWLWRWVHILDNTSKQPTIVQMYRTNQSLVFDSLQPGQMLLCRHMRLVHDTDKLKNSRQQRHVYVTSTSVSQYNTYSRTKVNRHHNFEKEQFVKNMRSWSRKLKTDAVKFRIRGCYSYPPLPVDKEEILKLPISITPSGDSWRGVVKDLVFREHKTIFIHAKLTAVWSDRSSIRTEVEGFDFDLSEIVDLDSVHSNEEELWTEDFNPHKDEMKKDFPPFLERDKTVTDTCEDRVCVYSLWAGLNCNTLLQSTKPLMCREVPKTLTFLDLVSGSFDSSSFESSVMSKQSLVNCLTSSKEVLGQRFLVTVDLYRTSPSSVDVLLKRAFLL